MGWKEHVRAALEGRHPVLGRRVEFSLLLIIVLSALAMGVETLPGLPQPARDVLAAAEILVVAIFTAEYALRIVVAERKLGYLLSFYGLVDLVAIAPFFITLLATGTAVDLQAARVFRLFRVVRLLKLVRYSSAIDRLLLAWRSVREEIIVFGLTSVVLLYVCALVIYQFEHSAQPEAFASVLDAMWWAGITLTTVGYGDIYPITPPGRFFTILMLLIALGIIAVPTGLVASALTAIRGTKPLDGGEAEASRRESASTASDPGPDSST